MLMEENLNTKQNTTNENDLSETSTPNSTVENESNYQETHGSDSRYEPTLHHSSSAQHGSGSHHSFGSRHTSASHHESGTHRSKKHSHHRSHSKKKEKSPFKRMQNWFDKVFGNKSTLVMNITAIVLVAVILGGLLLTYAAMQNKNVPSGSTEGYGLEYGGTTVSTQSETTTAIPSYWEDMVAEKTETVTALQTAGGVNSVSFVWASDTHIPNNDKGRTNDIGKVMARMLDNCDIPFAVLTGDIATRVSCSTEEEFIQAQEKIPIHLAPLWGTDRLLVALGNHDGCYGDESGPYRKQFTPERIWQLYFREQALDFRRVFSDDGLYFYVDNIAQKTRFIVLNSQFGGEYLADANGWAVNDRFAVSCYGQEQLDWLASVALDMPEGYSAVISVHVPPSHDYTVDREQFIGIVNAYCNKTTFSGSYTEGVDGWSNSTVNVDFTEAKGEVIAVFAGHVHQDTVDTTTMACPIITIISSGASVNSGIQPERPFHTDQETSFDVVTINKETRTIYCTRVGAGEDREIKY